MSVKTIHVICSQHFDIVWRREVQHYINLRAKLYRQIFDQLQAHPEMKWTLSQAYPLREFLDSTTKYYPAVNKMLQEGRLEIIGGLESICDLNMSSGTAILRNLEEGKRWFKETFDHEVNTGAFEDAFGLPAQTPQILKVAGYRFFKADRMPHDGQPNVSGDFVWTAPDGTALHCVAPLSGNGDWGWGFPDDPDDPTEVTMEQRREKVLSRLLKAADTDSTHVLYSMVGEEHDLIENLPELLAAASERTGADYRFSTYGTYYDALSSDYWDTRPKYDAETDFSRLFTGCYTTRKPSKSLPARLESQLIKTEMNSAFATTPPPAVDAWRKLFVMQFHDAICGCHIDENADYLEQLYCTAVGSTVSGPALLPCPGQIPDMNEKRTETTVSEEEYNFGGWKLGIGDGVFTSAKFKGHHLGRICNVMLREDSGTLWTEDYSGKSYEFKQAPEVVSLKQGNKTLSLTVRGTQNDFQNMWTGFSRLNWQLEYIFHNESPFVQVNLQTDFLGNSTEIALRWHHSYAESCLAGTPFGSRRHAVYNLDEGWFCGDAFPAAGWAMAGNGAVFNTDSPGHALRGGQLETIVLRSPVKRWSPFFPVSPTRDCHDNGKREFSFLYHAKANELKVSQLHRIAFENRLDDIIFNIREPFDCMPDNLVLASIRAVGDGKIEALVFEADGQKAVWNSAPHGIAEYFGPHQIKRVIIENE